MYTGVRVDVDVDANAFSRRKRNYNSFFVLRVKIIVYGSNIWERNHSLEKQEESFFLFLSFFKSSNMKQWGDIRV